MSVAGEQRRRKARAIAPALWRRGMTVEDLVRLPYASRDRGAPTMRSFARVAYAEADVQLTEPHSARSMTWILAAQLLAWMDTHPDDPHVPARDLSADRDRWCPPAATAPTSHAPAAGALTVPAPAGVMAPRCRRCHGPMPVDLARLEGWTHHPCCDPAEAAVSAAWRARLAAESRHRTISGGSSEKAG